MNESSICSVVLEQAFCSQLSQKKELLISSIYIRCAIRISKYKLSKKKREIKKHVHHVNIKKDRKENQNTKDTKGKKNTLPKQSNRFSIVPERMGSEN